MVMNKAKMIKKLNSALIFYSNVKDVVCTIIDSKDNKQLGLGTQYATNLYKLIAKRTKALKPYLVDNVYNYNDVNANLTLFDEGNIHFHKNGKAYLVDYTDNTKTPLCYGNLLEMLDGLHNNIYNNLHDLQMSIKLYVK